MKPLTFSLSLAVACGLCSVSLAGGHGKSMPSAQGPAPSPQVVASAQSVGCGGCDPCGPVKKCHFSLPKLPHFSLPKLCHSTSYEWVLKKKHSWSWSKGGGHHAAPACDSCGVVMPSAQGGPSPQGTWAAPQAAPIYGAPQAAPMYGAPQAAPVSSGQAALAPIGDPAAEPPTLPRAAADEAPRQADAGGLLLLSPSGY